MMSRLVMWMMGYAAVEILCFYVKIIDKVYTAGPIRLKQSSIIVFTEAWYKSQDLRLIKPNLYSVCIGHGRIMHIFKTIV